MILLFQVNHLNWSHRIVKSGRKNSKIWFGSLFTFTLLSLPTLKVLPVLYNIFIRIYVIAIQIAALWNSKATQWVKGRKDLFEQLQQKISKEDSIIWMHCSSAGEFEQGKPVLEQLKEYFPACKILVTFFSPSGFAAGEKYPFADYISYLPADTKTNARRLLEIANPKLAIFVKYEYWYYHLKTIRERNIPLLMISSIFRKKQIFFKWYG
ncbi:MAG: hypothetical protein ICV66_03360, partial [Chitinophagaceae bacterium]|nr:hypothetical protein [Chitinophagaceae bacterium]